MTIAEIKEAVDAGKKVHVYSSAYSVKKDSLGQYLIKCVGSDFCIGLTNAAGDELNSDEEDFYVEY